MTSSKPLMGVVIEEVAYCYPRWTTLPDNITLSVFSFLGASTLYQASLVCNSWSRVAFDNILWKDLFYRCWGISRTIPIAPGKQSWVQEYKRLLYHTPSVESEVLTQHTDEVLRVNFSHNGNMFATTSKDGFIMVWNTCFPTSLKYKADMKPFFWEYTSSSKFNYSDTLLLVSSGPIRVQGTSTSAAGEIAIFSLEEGFEIKKLVVNMPRDAPGGWLNDCYFLSCNEQAGSNDTYAVLNVNKAYIDNVTESAYEQMKLLTFRKINYFAIASGIVANCLNYNQHTVSDECTKYETGKNVESQRTGKINVNTLTVFEEEADRNDSCKFENVTDEKKSVQKQSKILYINPECLQGHEHVRSAFANPRVDASNEKIKGTSEYDTDDSKVSGQISHMDLAPCANNLNTIANNTNTEGSGTLSNTNNHDFGYTYNTDLENQEKGKACKNSNLKERKADDLSRVTEDKCFQTIDFSTNFEPIKNCIKSEDMYLIFRTGTKATFAHQIGLKRLKSLSTVNECGHPHLNATERDHGPGRNENCYDTVDHLIEMHGHVLGMCLSPDHRYLYVNCRSWPERYEIEDPCYPPQVADDIDIFVIDLFTLKKERTLHSGHMGYPTDYYGNLLDIDVCDEYVASGSEDRHGYMWDRHYGLCLWKYPHDDIVNSIAFNPTDPEVLVTVSDDYTIKIWRSLNRQREVTNAYSTESTIEHEQHIRDDNLDDAGDAE